MRVNLPVRALAQLALEDAADNRLEAQELRTDAADLKKQAEEKQQTIKLLLFHMLLTMVRS